MYKKISDIISQQISPSSKKKKSKSERSLGDRVMKAGFWKT